MGKILLAIKMKGDGHGEPHSMYLYRVASKLALECRSYLRLFHLCCFYASEMARVRSLTANFHLLGPNPCSRIPVKE